MTSRSSIVNPIDVALSLCVSKANVSYQDQNPIHLQERVKNLAWNMMCACKTQFSSLPFIDKGLKFTNVCLESNAAFPTMQTQISELRGWISLTKPFQNFPPVIVEMRNLLDPKSKSAYSVSFITAVAMELGNISKALNFVQQKYGVLSGRAKEFSDLFPQIFFVGHIASTICLVSTFFRNAHKTPITADQESFPEIRKDEIEYVKNQVLCILGIVGNIFEFIGDLPLFTEVSGRLLFVGKAGVATVDMITALFTTTISENQI